MVGLHANRHFHTIVADVPLNGVSVTFSPSTAPENIISLPPTSLLIFASLAVAPRIRSVSNSVS